jgi:GH24 family phage-related lysozyme (muramidase)
VAEFRITPRPQVQTQDRTPQEAVVAHTRDYGAGGPAPESGMAGLVRGLAAFNPALARYQDMKAQQDLEAARVAGKAAAQVQDVPRDALTGAPIEPPVGAPQAYPNVFRTSMAEALAQRVGVQNKLEAVSEYNNLKGDENFNPQQWLAEKRQSALAGITDPHATAIIGQHFTELEAHIAGEAERERLAKRDEVRASTITQTAADFFTADMGPDKIHQAYPLFLARAKALQYTPKEAAQYLYMQLSHLSNKLGGAPELFDVFDRKDEEGMTLIARNPQLAAHVDQAKAQAKQHRDKALLDQAEKSNAKVLMTYESDIDTNPASVTMDRILGDMTPYGAVQNPEKAAALWNRAQDALRKKQAGEQFLVDAQLGRLWIHDPKVQGQVLDQLAGPVVQQLAQATTAGDPSAIAQIGAQIMQMHSRTGATVPIDQLQRYVKTLVTNLPSAEGPSSQFAAAAELYKALSGNPQYRDLYFSEDTAKVLDGYTSGVGGGSDAKSAYVAAYQSISPEAKAAAEAYTKTPEFQKKLAKDVQKYVQGSSWAPRWIGGAGRPENVSVIGAAVANEVRSFRARNPYATDDQMDAFVEKWTQQNFALDTTTHSAVRVPPGLGGQAAQEALSSYSKTLTEQFKLGSRSDADWKVMYLPTGTEGRYDVRLFNGMASQAVGQVSLQDLMARDRANKVLSDQERLSLGQMREAMKSGQLPAIDPKLLAKAEAIKALKPEEVQAYRQASQKQFMERIQAIPSVSFGKPSFDNLQFTPRSGAQVDNQLTAKTALEMMTSPLISPGSVHQSYAASLITVGEGVMLKAYDDPAKGAGKNIGMGYNLNANRDKVNEDLKRSGVPEEQIQNVVEGRASLTPDQAKRLLMVSMPRYEKQVQDVAESTSPGLWARMTPAQKAVMVDVAWQVGDPSKFKKAWSALAAGDTQTFANETKVTYVDSSGERREDTRRNNLRASMLAGLSHWEASVQKYGSLPSSKLQAVALTNQ